MNHTGKMNWRKICLMLASKSDPSGITPSLKKCHSSFIGDINKFLFRLPGTGADLLTLAFILLGFVCVVSWWYDSAEREHSAGV